MKVVVACDSFKGCLSSKQVAQHLKNGILQVDSSDEVLTYVIGDGGEGTVEAFHSTSPYSRYIQVKTVDAYLKPTDAIYCIIDDGKTAMIEVANVIGLSMHDREHRMPLFASSYGVGIMICDAIKKGCTKIIVGLGGSATNDGGMGLLMALGAKFFDENHRLLQGCAANLEKIVYADFRNMLNLSCIEMIAACDVKNPLLGETGATNFFGKQKGLFPNQMKRVEKGMMNYVNKIRQYKNVDISQGEGTGATGGIGAVMIHVLHAKMVSGLSLLLSYSDFEEQVKTSDLVITGEGQTDRQTQYGKVPVGILEIAKKYDVPVICISGALGLEYRNLYDLGFAGIYSIADRAMTFQQALENAAPKLEAASYAVMKTIKTFKNRK